MNSPSRPESVPPETLPNQTAYLLKILLIAFVLRIAGMVLIHSYRANLANDESSHIAASLALGRGFADPFGGHTGPTAWLGPVYPFILSRLFLIFGVGTRQAAFAALFINSIFSTLTIIPVFFIAQYSFGLRVARWAAWTWALLPYALYWGIRWIWDTSLSTLLLTLLFWFTLELARASTLRRWIGYGLLWGLAGLTNTAELTFLPFAGLWICYHQFRQNKPFFRNATVGALLFFATISPWLVRDYKVFHTFIPIRGNFGLEFHLGNTEGAMGLWQVWLHPTQNYGEFHKYQTLGEVKYIHSKLEETLLFVHTHPGHFAYLLVAHFIYYWSESPHVEPYFIIYRLKFFFALTACVLGIWGLILALRQKVPAAGLYVILLLTYPTIYYVTFPHARYRHPIEPELVILILFFISQVGNELSTRKQD